MSDKQFNDLFSSASEDEKETDDLKYRSQQHQRSDPKRHPNLNNLTFSGRGRSPPRKLPLQLKDVKRNDRQQFGSNYNSRDRGRDQFNHYRERDKESRRRRDGQNQEQEYRHNQKQQFLQQSNCRNVDQNARPKDVRDHAMKASDQNSQSKSSSFRPTSKQIMQRHLGGSHPVYPYQKRPGMFTNSRKQAGHDDREKLDQSQVEYLQAICQVSRQKAGIQNQKIQQQLQYMKTASQSGTSQSTSQNVTRTFEQRIREVLTIWRLFDLMLNTKWVIFDDQFFLLNKRWFESWQRYTAYHYIIQKVATSVTTSTLTANIGCISDYHFSYNQVMLNGKEHPGEVNNQVLTLDPGKFYNRSWTKDDPTYTPLREGMIDNKDFTIVPKGVWKLFQNIYRGQEISRFAVTKNRNGQLFRSAWVPLVKICLMRRGDSIRLPKYLPLLQRTSQEKFKLQITQVFPQILNEWGITQESLGEDMRLWLLTDHEMPIREFIELFNSDIAQSPDQSFIFPGKSLEFNSATGKNLGIKPFYLDEIAALSTYNQSRDRVETAVFIEVRKRHKPWLFNLDQLDKAHQFYSSQISPFNKDIGYENFDQSNNVGQILLNAMPYLTYCPFKLTNKQFFVSPVSTNQIVNRYRFDANTYWKVRQCIDVKSDRKYSDYQIKAYGDVKLFYSKIIPREINTDTSSLISFNSKSLDLQKSKAKADCKNSNLGKRVRASKPEKQTASKAKRKKIEVVEKQAIVQDQSTMTESDEDSVCTVAPKFSLSQQTEKLEGEAVKTGETNDLEEVKVNQETIQMSNTDLTYLEGSQQQSDSTFDKKDPPKKESVKKRDAKTKAKLGMMVSKVSKAPAKKQIKTEAKKPILESSSSSASSQSSSQNSKTRTETEAATPSLTPTKQKMDYVRQQNVQQVLKSEQQISKDVPKMPSIATKMSPEEKKCEEQSSSSDEEITIDLKAEKTKFLQKDKHDLIQDRDTDQDDSRNEQIENHNEMILKKESPIAITLVKQCDQDVGDDEQLSNDVKVEMKQESPQKRVLSVVSQNGLANLGNTCYLNSAIQALANLPKFCDYLEQTPQGELLIIQSLLKLVWELKSGFSVRTSKVVDPSAFRAKLASINPQFKGNEQFDACEFIQILIDLLDQDLQSIDKLQQRTTLKVSQLVEGKIRQEVKCQQCGYGSVRDEKVGVLSVSLDSVSDLVDGKVNNQKAHLKVLYIVSESNISKKYDLFLSPGKYTLHKLKELVKERVMKDRKDLRLGKKEIIFADLRQQSELVKFFTDVSIAFNFVPGQMLTTFAFEVEKKNKDKIHVVNFVHLTKTSSSRTNQPKFFVLPKLIFFGENESLKQIGYKIYKDLRFNLHQALQPSINALNGSSFQDTSEEGLQNFNDAVTDDQKLKMLYEDLFIDRTLDLHGMPLPTPFTAFILLRDGRREKIDFRVNKKLGKVYDLGDILRLEVEFPLTADFTLMRQSLLRVINEPVSKEDYLMCLQQDEAQTTKLVNCIDKFFSSETLDGNNKLQCSGCNQLTIANKTLRLLEGPEILIIQLKRFKYIFGGKGCIQPRKIKLDTLVTFDYTLDLSKFIDTNPENILPFENQSVYSLMSVIHHHAARSALHEGGHYVTYSLNQSTQEWIKYDDNQVRVISHDQVQSEVFNSNVYLLIFSRK